MAEYARPHSMFNAKPITFHTAICAGASQIVPDSRHKFRFALPGS